MSSPTSANTNSIAALARLADEAAVNSSLLAKANSRSADALYRSQQSFVVYTRLLATASALAAGAAGVLGYYQYAKLYRVWRLRHPQTVRTYARATVGCAGFSLTSLLFLLSPVGFLAKHGHNEVQATQFDALTVSSLVLQQQYATLHAFCTLKACEEAEAEEASRRSWLPACPSPFQWKKSWAGTDTGISLRRRLLSVDEVAFKDITVVEEPEVSLGSEAEPASTKTTTKKERNAEERKAELASQLLLPEKEDSGNNSGSLEKGRKSAEVFTIHSTTKDLWRCYDLLNEEWMRIVEAQNQLTGAAI